MDKKKGIKVKRDFPAAILGLKKRPRSEGRTARTDDKDNASDSDSEERQEIQRVGRMECYNARRVVNNNLLEDKKRSEE